MMRMLANVKQKTIQPIIESLIAPGTKVFTDEYDIYCRLSEWGYQHQTVCHSKGEYARDEDGDGFHANTMEGARQHDGGRLVAVTKLAATAPRYFAGATPALPCLF